jgi:benzoyl-CoA reductase/2-hydroxyglutaryl-CoA dehydratase subunit BcrC/BadD/HgdB
MLMLKEEHNALLTTLLEELKNKRSAPSTGPKIILSGSLCAASRPNILDLIEEAGMIITDDDLYVGWRYFAHDARGNGDPLEALTDRYLERNPPCPTKVDSELDWSDDIIDMATQNQAQGVITLIMKYCPPHLAYYPDVEKRLREKGIRHMMLELEHEAGSLEQIKTRFEAFAESLGVS